MEKYIVILIVCLLATVCGCAGKISTTEMPSSLPDINEEKYIVSPDPGGTIEEDMLLKNCKIYIYNEEKIYNYVYLDYGTGYAELPLVSILTDLGATFIWETSYFAKIEYNNKNI